MSWLTGWLNTRQSYRFDRAQTRELRARNLEREGRWAEFAEEMAAIGREYAKLTRITDHRDAVFNVRLRRCAALVRAGRVAQAKAEAAELAEQLARVEGPDGPTQRRLAERMAAAERESRGG